MLNWPWPFIFALIRANTTPARRRGWLGLFFGQLEQREQRRTKKGLFGGSLRRRDNRGHGPGWWSQPGEAVGQPHAGLGAVNQRNARPPPPLRQRSG